MDGVPLHVAHPADSAFKILPFAEFQSLTALQLQDLLRQKNLVVTNNSKPGVQFNERGLRMLSPLDSLVPIQGAH
jgi:hypothetical protein